MNVIHDQYYTKPDIANQCWNKLCVILEDLNKDIDSFIFLEPSAGTGSFYNLLPHKSRIGIDIDPKDNEIKKMDFLLFFDYINCNRKIITVGNPPFGTRCKMAVEFFNHAATFSEIIAFILRNGFNRWNVQRNLDPTFKLILRFPLDREAFYLVDESNYSLDTEFQVWTKWETSYPDISPPKGGSLTHTDFEIRRYNNTESALKVFDKPFNFAVPCQGWQDYSIKETIAENCEKSKQWMLFYSKDSKVVENLKSVDFNKLAHQDVTTVPGFSKREFIAKYNDQFNCS